MTPPITHDIGFPIIAMFTAMTPAAIGFSESADALVQIEKQIDRAISDSVSNSFFLGGRAELQSLVVNYFETRNEAGWDGYDASPITVDSKATALEIIKQLPYGIQKPDIIPTSVGGISFEWDLHAKSLSLEVEDKELIWSFIDFGSTPKRKRSGIEEVYADILPKDLQTILREEFSVA